MTNTRGMVGGKVKGTKGRPEAAERCELAQLFAANLARFREAMDLSQQALASRAGLSVGYVSMLEQGKRSPPLETITHLADALNVKDPRRMFEKPRGWDEARKGGKAS